MSRPAASSCRLSVALIVRDEEQRLPDTLASVAGLADEIVVVDTGSTDRTRDIAADAGARVIDFPWCDDFSAARNAARQSITGEWVLWLDAGERLDRGTAERLREDLIGYGRDKIFLAMIELPPEAPGAAVQRIGQARLLPVREEFHFVGRVKEYLVHKATGKPATLALSPLVIHRSPHDHDPVVKRQRAQRNLALIADETEACGPSPRMLNATGEAYLALGDMEQAAAYYRDGIIQSPANSPEQLDAYYGLIACYDGKPDQHETLVALALKALEAFPADAQLLCAMGNYLQAQGRQDVARRAFEAALRCGQVEVTLWHVKNVAELAAQCLSVLLELEGDYAGALAALQQSAELHAPSDELRARMLDLHVQQADVDAALQQVEHLAAAEHQPAMRSAVRGACLAARQNWIPARAYLERAYAHGCRGPLCLRWLSIVLMSTGQHASARSLLEEWRTAQPYNVEPLRYLEALTPAATIPAPHRRINQPVEQDYHVG